MDSQHNLKRRESSSDDDDEDTPVMPLLPVMATPVLPADKARALSFPHDHDIQEQDELQDIEAMGHRYDPNLVPMFEKRASATILEVFYDFWVVANLGVFMQLHSVGDADDLWSYIGYISLVWFNWFLVGCFDVRYVTDSIFERFARTLHLGVVVGFVVVAPNYDPTQQNKGTWQCMSLILMFSRLVLIFEYLTILWHIRKFRQGKVPLVIAIAFHFIAAMVYLGVSFRFKDGEYSRAYIAWYVLMVGEAIVQLGLSLWSKVLSFEGTHLCERMTLLTMFILGEAVMVIMDSVVSIVKNNGWSDSIIGVLVAAVGTVYFVFMLYNDWMAGYARLVGWRQIAWSILHYPFHLSSLLFIKGATQFIIWWKVTQVENWFLDQVDHAWDDMDSDYITSADVKKYLQDAIDDVFKQYKPIWNYAIDEVPLWLDQIDFIDDNEWNIPAEDNSQSFWDDWDSILTHLRIAVVNSMFANFKMDPIQELFDSGELDKINEQYAAGQLEEDPFDVGNRLAYDNTTERFYLVFQYVFTCAGISLITMTILYLLIKRRPTSPGVAIFFYVRTAIFFMLGIGLSLVTLVSLDWEKGGKYLYGPWLLPTLCFVYLFLIILTHLPNPPPLVVFSRLPNPFGKWIGGGKKADPGMGTGMTMVATREETPFGRLRGFMSNNEKGAFATSSSNGGQYSQVQVTDMSMHSGTPPSTGIHHEQPVGAPGYAYDPYAWNGQHQQPTEYFGAVPYPGQQQGQQQYQQQSHYQPYQPQQQGY